MEKIIQYRVKEDIPRLFLEKGMILTRYPEINPELDGRFYNKFIMFFWIENTPELFEPYIATTSGLCSPKPFPKVVLSNSIPGDLFKEMFPQKIREERYKKYTSYWDGVPENDRNPS